MKILVISNLFPPHHVGGYEMHCQRMVEGLRGLGHDVEVLTSDHGNARSSPGIHRRLKIHGMFGHPWLPIRQLRKLEFHNNQATRELARQIRPDLVFCWNFSGLSKSILFTLRALDLPAAFCVCDHWIARSADADVWLNWWNRKAFLPRILRLVGVRDYCQTKAPTNPTRQLDFQRVYFCSQALRDFTANAGGDVRHGAVIYCPMNTEIFSGPPKSAESPLQRLLYVGRLHEDKGVMTALRAMARLRDKFVGRLSIYGRGEPAYETTLRNFVSEEKLPVTFASVSASAEMPDVYRAHDALLFTSEWAEPFALTPLEAMACGLPVIGTTTGGSIELFRHGQNALTYSAGNASELAQRILDLDRDRALRSRLAAAGQAEVRARYAEPLIVRQVETFLRDSLAQWRPRPLPDYP